MNLDHLLCFEEEIVQCIRINIASGRCSRQKTGPLPTMVLSIQYEVGAYNRGATSDRNQNDEHQQHKSVHIIDFVSPKRCENEVHLDENRCKWQNAANEYYKRSFHEPFLLRNWPWYRIDATRKVGFAIHVASNDGANQVQWQNNKYADARYRDHCSERNGPRCMVIDGDEIDEESCATYEKWY